MCEIAISEFFDGCNIGNIVFFVHRRRGAYSYCVNKNNWEINGVPCREIGIPPECLNKGCEAIFITILRELVHVYNSVNNIPIGRMYLLNGSFYKTCVERGIYCVKSKDEEYILPTDLLPEEYHNRILRMISKLSPEEYHLANNIHLIEKTPKEKKDGNRNLMIHICPECKQKIRARRDINIVCGECNKQLVKQEMKDRYDYVEKEDLH